MDKAEKEKQKQAPEQQRPEKMEQTPTPPQASEEKSNEDDREDSGFDFGGLPNRNLKKNLGCG